jgi:hypothetical protein
VSTSLGGHSWWIICNVTLDTGHYAALNLSDNKSDIGDLELLHIEA